ncbi:MAG: DUF4159 domain-containing protein [Alphaproteobacteria bacterium]|nr:DUF4159 domain-containing protein [Alphaproteobacteria bacterium]
MLSLGPLTFFSPWLLAACAVIPALWWILRVMPPQPKRLRFPAFFLLADLKTDIKTAAHTPWWLLLLRSLIMLCFIMALADPVLKLSGSLPGHGGSVVIAIDNGWPSAANWNAREARLKELLAQIRRSGRSVVFLPTAPDALDGKLHSYGPMDVADAEKWIGHLTPQPWPDDQGGAVKVLDDIKARTQVTYNIYLSDGMGIVPDDAQAFMSAMQHNNGLLVVKDDKVNAPYILRRKAGAPGQLAFTLERMTATPQAVPLLLGAYAEGGGVLDTYKASFPAGRTAVDIKWDLLNEMRNKIARVSLQNPHMASATYMTDSQWQQHPIGVISDPSTRNTESFLSEVYYLRRALQTNGTLDIDEADGLVDKTLSAIIWPDSAGMTAPQRVNLLDWVEKGGFLIRFAGPNLAANPDDPLLPVPLCYGQRAMEGAMTWEKPVGLGKIPQDSPLAGLSVPDDVTVTRQVLAKPTPEVFEKTWLQLGDGTPLITGSALGKGEVVLIHTTAGPDWSNFCYSGLYVEALQRMISLSTGIGGFKGQTLLSPFMVMDGFGRLKAPAAKSVINSLDPSDKFVPSPQTPPGLYGVERQFQVFNLGDSLPPMVPLLSLPAQVDVAGYALSGEKSLKADFFRWAIFLLMLDTALTLWLRGLFELPSVKRGVAGAVLAAAILFHPGAARAASANDDDTAAKVTGIYLAYIETGDQDIDQTSYNGLTGLMRIVNTRTTIQVKGVQGVDPANDPLYFYPVIYWPMTGAQQPLSVSAARNIQNYLSNGGLILFDTRDRQFVSPGAADSSNGGIGTRKLRELTRNISIPELMPVTDGHILTKSFYLMDSFPGLYAGGQLWVEKEPSPANDSVTSVIIGGNDWAPAWSQSPSDHARYSVTPGGERQREMAYRFGVNLLMAALAGNYKSDQVHVPYILERLGR